MEKNRINLQKQELAVYKINDMDEREKLANKLFQRKVNHMLQASVQPYSSVFNLDTTKSEQIQDLERMKNKINDPYAYYQEQQNQIMKTYEMMAMYKTVDQIEKEIREAQHYLKDAEYYYTHVQGRTSPTRSEYDYIQRLVDDGEPVKLSKKMRKALKMKDEYETID